MDKLTELGIKYGTDKAGHHTFTAFYSKFVDRFTNPTMVEIGIENGASLKMWEEYYGNPTIIAVDIKDKKQFDTSNTKTIVADQGNVNELSSRLKEFAPSYDLIIDDGSHIFSHQISCFATLFPHLKSGGIYILEDLHTSFIHGQYNLYGELLTPYDFVYRVCRGFDIEDCQHATPDQIDYLKNNIAEGHIYQKDEKDFMHSITSIIIKK